MFSFFISRPFMIEALVDLIEFAVSQHRNKLKENRIRALWADK